jgi:hypothetical protein
LEIVDRDARLTGALTPPIYLRKSGTSISDSEIRRSLIVSRPPRTGAGPAFGRAGGELRRAGDHLEALEAGRNHRDADLLVHGRVDHGAEDDVRVGVCGLNAEAGGLVHLEEAEVLAAGDVEAACPSPRRSSPRSAAR